jgi:hypothetical protein
VLGTHSPRPCPPSFMHVRSGADVPQACLTALLAEARPHPAIRRSARMNASTTFEKQPRAK